ncbi:hypothetical protein SUGI_0189640 [Cryptomeria japonica]|nr:hypothetical protein SUGI_0189640 [Cryptomeria japonica]
MQDGSVRIFKWEVSHGFSWARQDGDKTLFETALHNFMRELNEVKGRVTAASGGSTSGRNLCAPLFGAASGWQGIGLEGKATRLGGVD